MAQKFIGLEDAATQLGVPKERLNEIREAGEIRAYRDGTSWKFRSEDIEKLSQELPEKGGDEDAGSDISLADDGASSLDLSASGLDLASDDLDLSGETSEKSEGASDVDLASVDEPTVPADDASGDDNMAVGVEPIAEDDDAESILLSEDELGDSPDRPPSTIIGRSQLREESDDDDLELSVSGEGGTSDVRLAESVDDVLSGKPKAPGSEKFENLDELDIDLEAESSRLLESGDVAAAQQAAAAKEEQEKSAAPSPEASDELVLDSGSGLNFEVDTSGAGDAGDTGVQEGTKKPGSDSFALDTEEALDLELTESGVGEQNRGGKQTEDDKAASSDAVLQDDGSDDMVLGGGSDDFTLSSADSGINLKPSDSGLALDDAQLDLGGSAVGSSLDLGGSQSEALAPGDSDPLAGASAMEIEGGEDFNLQPLAEEDADDEEDSSQIIELDAVEEVTEEPALGEGAALGASPAMSGAGAPAMAPEASFSVWNVVGLGLCGLLMLITGVMMIDILRTMWSWDQPFTTSSPLIETLLGIVGMNN